MKEWIEEIVEQICYGIILRESKPDASNRLSLISVDNAVEISLKFYCSYHGLLKDGELDSSAGFFSALDKVNTEGKIMDKEKSDIRQYHKIRNDLYHRPKLITVKDSIIDNYVKLAKIVLNKLFDYNPSELEWKKLVNEIRKSLLKEKFELKEPVEYEEKSINGNNLVFMKTPAELQNTESIMLIIHGFITKYAQPPSKEELKKSLMISGRDISQKVLDPRISDLKRTGFLEKNELKLKGKALTRLRKKFLI